MVSGSSVIGRKIFKKGIEIHCVSKNQAHALCLITLTEIEHYEQHLTQLIV